MELEYTDKNRRRSKLYIVVGVIVALLVAGTVYVALQASGLTTSRDVEMREVVVATRDIPARKAIEEGDVIVRTVVADATNETAFRRLDEVLGRIAGVQSRPGSSSRVMSSPRRPRARPSRSSTRAPSSTPTGRTSAPSASPLPMRMRWPARSCRARRST